MVALTPEMAGNSMIFVLVGYVIALVFQVYMLFLNWKQSRVKDTTQNLLIEIKEIKNILLEYRNDKHNQ